MKEGDRVEFELGLSFVKGAVVKVNDKTVVVQLDNGQKIKRHIDKHGVICLNTSSR